MTNGCRYRRSAGSAARRGTRRRWPGPAEPGCVRRSPVRRGDDEAVGGPGRDGHPTDVLHHRQRRRLLRDPQAERRDVTGRALHLRDHAVAAVPHRTREAEPIHAYSLRDIAGLVFV